MEGEREYSPPFWPQHQRRPSPSPPTSGLRPWVLVLLSSVFIILFLPAFLSSSVRGLRPGSLIKNGWDTLNLCLVLFAILCGLLGRNNDDDDNADKSPRSTEWPAVGYAAPPSVQNSRGDPAVSPMVGIRRMRSSSSYPDLRQEVAAEWAGSAEAWRFSDDIQLYHRGRRSEVETKTIPMGSGEGWRFSDDVQTYHRRWRSENNHRALESTPEAESKTIPVDTFLLRKSPPRSRSPPPTPPSPPPPPPHGHSRKRSAHNKFPEKEVEQETKMEEEKPQQPPLPPPPPPPPPPATRAEKRSPKKKNGGGAKDMATAIALFYHKKRKKGSKTNKFHDDISPLANASAAPQAAVPPPPPPPPPPPSLFHQLFSHKKGGTKSRRIHSTPAPPPPPPPPPPAPPKRRSKKHVSPPPTPPPPPRAQKSRNQVSRSPPPPPPPPAPPRVNLYKKREKSNLSGFSLPSSSSLPPPPPPPPSPPPTDLQLRFSEEEIVVDGILGGGEMKGEKREGKDRVAPVFCPSPDVNNKADLFIARFRAGLKLEKLNSLREKQRRQQEQQHQDGEFMMVGGIFDDDIIPSRASPSTATAGGSMHRN